MRSGRLWIFGGCCLLALFVALLIGCLLETPQTVADVAPERASAAPTDARIQPAPPAGETSDSAPRPQFTRETARVAVAQRASAALPTSHGRDANGHVISERRYLDSVYTAFRQEAACG